MKIVAGIMVLVATTLVIPAEQTGRLSLVPHEIHSITITLNSRLVQLEPMTVTSDGRTLIREFATLVTTAESSDDHKCQDIGEILFDLRDGGAVRVGLLPAHTDGLFNLRLYDDAGYTVWQVDREQLLGLLERIGIPARDAAFPG